jgi:hypothetical protein
MKGKGNEKKDDSYFAVSRRRRRRSMMMIVIPVVAVVIALGVVFGLQANQHGGPGGKIVLHIHPHLNVMVDGKPITVPKNIGIDSSLYKDHSLDKYGMQGMAPLHTHDDSGTIHVESTVKRDYTLGEFLNIWGGLDVNAKTVKATVNGKPVSDYRNILLRDREQINLVVS